MRRRVTVFVCVCVSVKSHLTSGASVCPENTVTYSEVKRLWVFSETTLLQRSSTPSVEGHVQLATFPWKAAHAHYCITCGAEGSAFITLLVVL